MGRLRRVGLVGNGWVLAGAVLCLLKLPGIIWAGNENLAHGLAGRFAVVLLGRISLFIGLRCALVDSGRSHTLLEFAVVAAAASVTLETAFHWATYVVWRSRLFSLPLIAIRATSGIASIMGQLWIAPSLQPLADIASCSPFLSWIWALWAGIVCLRARTAHPAVSIAVLEPATTVIKGLSSANPA